MQHVQPGCWHASHAVMYAVVVGFNCFVRYDTDDNIVDIRASSRGKPAQSDGKVSLSLSKGVVYDQNLAQRQLERLRKAMQWESVPVITGFDPRYNQDKQLFFEKLYQQFLPKRQRTAYADEGP